MTEATIDKRPIYLRGSILISDDEIRAEMRKILRGLGIPSAKDLQRRKEHYVIIRHAILYALYWKHNTFLTRVTYNQLGYCLADVIYRKSPFDHSTVLYSINQVERVISLLKQKKTLNKKSKKQIQVLKLVIDLLPKASTEMYEHTQKLKKPVYKLKSVNTIQSDFQPLYTLPFLS